MQAHIVEYTQFMTQVKFGYGPSGSSGRSSSWFLLHEVTRQVSTPPWMGCQFIAELPPSIKFAGNHLYTWVERGTVRVKCFAQKHNTMSPTRARTRTTRSGDERTNHEATTLPVYYWASGNFFFANLHFSKLCNNDHPLCLSKLVGDVFHQFLSRFIGVTFVYRITQQLMEAQHWMSGDNTSENMTCLLQGNCFE